MNIAIDGPAGAGKSTIARIVAKKEGSIYVDTGAMYRAMALYFMENKISPDDQKALEEALAEVDISISYRDGVQHILLNGEDVTDRLREETVGNMASATSVNAKVREKLVALQQKLAKTASVVMDGRDIGTVVLPDAEVKIYLTASAHTRAVRRYEELKNKPDASNLPSVEQIEADIKDRDYRDMHREHSPLKKADDAVEVDSSDLTIEQVVDRILEISASKKAN